MSLLIDCAYVLLLLVVGPFYWVKRRWTGKRTAPIGERLGDFTAPAPASGPRIWIHAVSVGEVLAARGLIASLKERRADVDVFLTATTVAGLDVARKTYPDLRIVPSPLDFSFAVRRFLRSVRPDALVLIELELWPNLLRAAERAGVPVFVANARVSERSAGRYRLLAKIWPGFLRPVSIFLAQGPEHVARLRDLGLKPERIVQAGNLKFDNAVPSEAEPLRSSLRAELGFGPEDRVLVAGSTHPGEERFVIEAFLRIASGTPAARLLLAPRHLERLFEVTALLSALQLRASRRSDRNRPPGCPCVLLDTTGELGRFYAIADVAFVGGTMVPIGGHNLLEPAAFGVPMVTGPHLKSVRDTADLFAEAGALVEVKDAAALAACVGGMFASPEDSRKRGALAKGLIESRRGAAARCADTILAGLRRGAARERMSDG